MSEPQHVLVIRRRYLGDIVLLGSFLRNIKLHWPQAKIHVVAEPAYAAVLSLNPDVDSVLIMPKGVTGYLGFIPSLRRMHFTHVFNFDNTEGTALITRLSGASFRLGLYHSGYKLKFPSCYTHRINDPSEEHEGRPITEYYLRTLASAGIPIATREVRLVPKEKDLLEGRRFMGAGGPVLMVHPGSRSSCRIWPTERFAEVCDRIQDELGVQVVLVGGPSDRALVGEIKSKAKSHLFALPEAPSLPRFAALARLATVLLCHDSGPMHVAAAVGTPVVALYGSQNRVLFQPAGEHHTLLQAPLPCVDCVAPDKCQPLDSYHNYCVRRLSVERVFAAVRDQFDRMAAPRT